MKKLFNFFVQSLPHSFVFCLGLTFLAFVIASLLTPHDPFNIIYIWGQGLWSLNNFAFQMIFVLVGGHLIADSPLMKKFFVKLAKWIPGNNWAIYIMCLFSCLVCWLNWGLGLVSSAFLAREIYRNKPQLSYGALVGSAYAGFLVWHGGLSGSIPLKLVTPSGKLGELLSGQSIPLSETIFQTPSLVITGLLILLLPIAMMLLAKKEKFTEEEVVKNNDSVLKMESNPDIPIRSLSLGEKINESNLPFRPIIVFGLFYLYLHFQKGGSFDLNFVNFVLYFFALIFHRNIVSLVPASQKAIQSATGILLQFPFYAGIMAIMSESGLANMISEWFINNSSYQSFPLMTFLSAGLLNVFVPSGGGQWAIQAPLVIPAAQELGIPLSKVAMAVAWGDSWTNMIQPFWAIPLLGIAGIGLKEITKYCLVAFTLSGVVCLGVLYWF